MQNHPTDKGYRSVPDRQGGSRATDGRILVVDDNEDILFALNLLLKPLVEDIRVATKPELIDKFYDQIHPDLVLLDMNYKRDSISGEEGFEWLEHILHRDPQAVVILMTA